MFSVFNKPRKMGGILAIQMFPTGVTFAYLNDPKSQPAKCKICEFKEFDDIALFPKYLTDFIAKNKLKNLDCNWILHPAYYRLLLIDAPKVSQHEYRAAIRWQIKNMIDIPIEDLSVEIFSPTGEIKPGEKLYVIAAQKSFLQENIDFLLNNQLNPVAINTHELAIGSLLTQLFKAEDEIMFLQLLEDSSIFMIINDHCIHFARHIMHGINELNNQQTLDNFVAEIKRCLDYYQRQLKQTVADKLFLAPLANADKIIANLEAELAMKIQDIDINNLISFPKTLSKDLQAHCCAAIGSILSKEDN
jgi:MSHA biogenesis protein MshI